MNHFPTVLLIEEDSCAAELIRGTLLGVVEKPVGVKWVRQLSEALKYLQHRTTGLIILGLSLPGSEWHDSLKQLLSAAPALPVLILCDEGEEEAAHQSVQCGAADFINRSQANSIELLQLVHYLIEKAIAENLISIRKTLFRTISDGSPLGIFVSDEAGQCIYTNTAYHKISGVASGQSFGLNWSSTIHPDDRERALADWHSATLEQTPFQSEIRYLRQDKSLVWARLNTATLYEGGQLSGYVQIVEDISERKSEESRLRKAEEELFIEKERAQVTLDSIGDAVMATDTTGKVTYMNLVAEDMTGWPREDALGRPLTDVFQFIDGETREKVANPAQIAIEQNRRVELAANCILIRRDGVESPIEDSASPIHNRDGKITGAVVVFHDVSMSRTMTMKMSHMAQHDFLTGLPNRILLTERLTQTLALARRHQTQVALLFMDLDLFKDINDSLGHLIGDQLLKSAARRMEACVRATDTVCRQGGDEFVILLAGLDNPLDAVRIADNLLTAFAQPHEIEGHELYITLSIGISIFPGDGKTPDAMIKNADVAMYHAKENGRNSYQFFKDEMNQDAEQRLFVINSLRRALRNDEFELYYQPKIDLASGKISGAEALIRWQDPVLGLVLPEKFIATAEESGLIVPIGKWVLNEACRQVKAWQEAGLPVVPVAVNVSAQEFRHREFLPGISLILQHTGLAPGLLEFELTESVLMEDGEATGKVLTSLKNLGISLAIDDFGTGYSSLSYLKRLPINTLKIDQTFVRDIATDSDDATIFSAVICMGKSLSHKVIAEGVETEQQLAFLKSRHCNEGQGYQFSYPLTADDFGRFLVSYVQRISEKSENPMSKPTGD